MGGSIFDMQNSEFMLRCLVAQRRDYRLGKRANAYKRFFTVLFVVLTVVASLVNNEVVLVISFLCAILLSIMNRHLDGYVVKHKRHAAAIQQYFDVTLFSAAIGNATCDWGGLLTKAEIIDSFSDIEDSEIDSVRDWYNDYSKLSPVEQVFQCQQTNIRWDKKLRSEYKRLIIIASILFVLLLVCIAIGANPTFVKCITVVAWILPIADYAFAYYDGLCKDMKRLEILQQQSNTIESALSIGEACETEIINFQTLIMESRETSVLIPDWYYNRRKDKHQKEEDSIADIV